MKEYNIVASLAAVRTEVDIDKSKDMVVVSQQEDRADKLFVPMCLMNNKDLDKAEEELITTVKNFFKFLKIKAEMREDND